MRSLLFSLLILALVAVAQGANVRFGNFFSGHAEIVNVTFNNDALHFAHVPFGTLVDYVALNDGDYNVTLWGPENALLSRVISVKDFTTVAALGVQNLALTGFSDSFSRPDVAGGKFLLRFIDAVEAPAGEKFNIFLNGTKVAGDLAFSQASNYVTQMEGSLHLVVNFTNGEHFFDAPISGLERGLVYTLVAAGSVASPSPLPPFIDYDYQRANVRVALASPDAPTVDVTVGGVSYNSLSFSSQSNYQEVQPGSQNLTVRANGQTLLSVFTTDLAPFKSYTVLVYGFVKAPENNTNTLAAQTFLDPPVDPDTARVRFGNFVPDLSRFLVSFDKRNFTLAYGTLNATTTYTVAPGSYNVIVYNYTSVARAKRHWRRSLTDFETILTTTITLKAGDLYTVLIEGSGKNLKIVADGQPSPSNDSGGLSSGAIAGIVIGTVFGAILLVGLIVYFYRRANYQSIP